MSWKHKLKDIRNSWRKFLKTRDLKHLFDIYLIIKFKGE